MAEPIQESMQRVVAAFGGIGIPFMFVGGIATFAYGEPRTTRDVDVAVDVTRSSPAGIRTLLEDAGFQVRGPAKTEFGTRFWALGAPFPVEVFLSGQHELHQREFARREMHSIGTQEFPFISKEDLVLRKLVNLRLRRSETDVQDILTILFDQWTRLDLDYIRENGAPHRVVGAFERFAASTRRARKRANLVV